MILEGKNVQHAKNVHLATFEMLKTFALRLLFFYTFPKSSNTWDTVVQTRKSIFCLIRQGHKTLLPVTLDHYSPIVLVSKPRIQ